MGDALNSLIIQAYKEKCDEVELLKKYILHFQNKDINQTTEHICDKDCPLYMKHGYIQDCIDSCEKLMSCKDVITDTCKCNFCDVPNIILEDIKCRHVADLDWWYNEGYYEKDKKYYKRKFEEALDELDKTYARIAELKQVNKELDDENASLLASKIEMLEQMQELEKKFNLVGELTKYYGAKKC